MSDENARPDQGAPRTGIYDKEPTEHMKTKKKFLLESDRVKQERKQKGFDALDSLRGMFDED